MSTTVAIPFHVDSTGAIQTVVDDDRALQDRVMALVSTVPGERLMRADYGVRTTDALFDPIVREIVLGELKLEIAQAIRKWEPAAVITDIRPIATDDPTSVAMDVRVGRADTPNAELNRQRQVFVTVGGDTYDAGN